MKPTLNQTIKEELGLLTEQSQPIPMEVEVIECGAPSPSQTLTIDLWGVNMSGGPGNPVPPQVGDTICEGVSPGGSNWDGDPNMCMPGALPGIGTIYEIIQVLGPSTLNAVDFGLLSVSCPMISFDCNNQWGNCMYDPNVAGQYTSLLDCQMNCNAVPESFDCVAGACVSAGFTGAGQYPDYVTCFNTSCGGPEPGATFTASICECTMDPVLQIPCPPLGTTRNVTVPYTIDFLTPNQGDTFSSHCISGTIGVSSWMCTWEVTSISGYGEPQIQRNRNSSTDCDRISPPKDEYHMWTECSGFVGGGSESMTWSGLPGYVSGADLSNSQIFYDWIDTTVGGINVGDVIKIDLSANNQNYTLCLQYDGVTNNVTPVTPWNSPLTIVSSHTDCEDCIKEPVENFACMTGVAGPAGSTTCMGPGNYTMGQANVQNIYPTMAACQADPECGDDPEERGCLDPMALNYNQCCQNIPGCIPVLPNPECCEYEQGDHKGCMDSTAINYMTCCDTNIPGCVPTANSPECCKYEGEPDPCKLNPKECWFCTPGDIDTSDWQDPMAIVNANGGCIQFLSTSGPFASSYSGQMFTTKIDCENNTECSPSDGGETKHCTCCKKGENGTISGFSLSTAIPVGDSCSQFNNSQPGLYGCVDTNLWSLSKCKNQGPIPTNNTQLSEEIKRYKQLL